MLVPLFTIAGLVTPALCWPKVLQPRATAVMPVIGTPTLLANVTDPTLNRDSCGACRIGSRMFWTCRDTLGYDPSTGNSIGFGPVTNSASWADFNAYAYPLLQPGAVGAGSSGSNNILTMYGGPGFGLPAYYPVQADQCPPGGSCGNGSRWAVWPNQPPAITMSGSDGSATGYTVIPNVHYINGTVVNGVGPGEVSAELWRVSYVPQKNSSTLPNVTLVNERFWTDGQINFGSDGTVVGTDGNLYLYGHSKNGSALARVATGSVETKSAYQYYYNGAWNNTIPNINDTAAAIPNAGAGGQGTFYYSYNLTSYVWIGQRGPCGQFCVDSFTAEFYLTTAPTPQGPWINPYHIYSGANGGGPSYTLQAHPEMENPADQHGIFITWTQQFTGNLPYVTPLVYLPFK